MYNLIRINENNVRVANDKTFKNQLIVQQGFWSKYLNDINLNFLDRMILIGEPEIHGDIVFSDDVYASTVALTNNLTTKFILNPRECAKKYVSLDQSVEGHIIW